MVTKLPKLFLLLSLFLLIFTPGLAQGDLMIMPKRIVFDGNQRSHEINLANTGSDTATYAISFLQYKMTEDGKFEEATEPEVGQRFASDFLRYYPRRVSLAPNEAQTVRVQLTRSGNLEQGEYRSHVYFRAVEEQTALGIDEEQEADGISIQIKTVFGISIPVIIRHGESTTSLEIENLNLDLTKEVPLLSMTLKRNGNMSVYGDLKVEHVLETGISTEVGLVKGISVYTPNSLRNFTMPLHNTEENNLTSGKLRVIYTSESGEVLATNEISLQ